MSNPGASPLAPTAPATEHSPSPEDALVCAFNALRDELVSTLLFIVGNRDDAQDAAQEAFLKCWRARAGLAGGQNLRAWVFPGGLDAAPDPQRSARHRPAEPLLRDAALPLRPSRAPR